jgi:hypothetical protein
MYFFIDLLQGNTQVADLLGDKNDGLESLERLPLLVDFLSQKRLFSYN